MSIARPRPMVHGLALGAMLLAAWPALAGPPLLCHPFDIGSARSLPWSGTGWHTGRADYDPVTLVADTEALLTPATPVVVRMETLRRAAIYASADGGVAGALLKRLNDRARAAEVDSRGQALALFDAGWFTETLEEVVRVAGYEDDDYGVGALGAADAGALRALLRNADGYPMIRRSLALHPDPALELAAALVSAADGRADAYARHAQNARAAAQQDPLVQRNLRQIAN